MRVYLIETPTLTHGWHINFKKRCPILGGETAFADPKAVQETAMYSGMETHFCDGFPTEAGNLGRKWGWVGVANWLGSCILGLQTPSRVHGQQTTVNQLGYVHSPGIYKSDSLFDILPCKSYENIGSNIWILLPNLQVQ